MSEAVLRAKDLNVFYKNRKRKLFSGSKKIQILHDVSFEMEEGEVLAIAGESGCGKTTLGRSMIRLIEPTSGIVTYKGENLLNLSGREMMKRGFTAKARAMLIR